MKIQWIVAILTAITPAIVVAEGHSGGDVMIAKDIREVTVELNGEQCVIERSQDRDQMIHSMYASTHRGKIQPVNLGQGIETIGELELLDYMQRAQTDDSVIVVDTRTPGWHANIRIPCTLNVPYTDFGDNYDDALFQLTESFGVLENEDGSLDFSQAKTIVGYCNGYWCGQTPAMYIRAENALTKLGYPSDKLKYYRGGMQAWTSLGLTVSGSEK